MNRKLKIAGITILAAAAAGAAVALIVRDQVDRRGRDLFSSHVLKRLAALAHIDRLPASVDLVTLLRDFIAWEERSLLRNRARTILDRMSEELESSDAARTLTIG